MKMKELAVLSTAAVLTAMTVAGCSDGQKGTITEATKETEAVATTEATIAAETEIAETTGEAAGTAAEVDEESCDTGDVSEDNARNQDETGESELLVVSFGTSYNDSRRLTTGAIEDAIEKAFPDFAVRRGFTSQITIDHIESRDDVAIDNVGEVLDCAGKNGVRSLVIQPTHLMSGPEYTGLVSKVAEYSDAFEKVVIGKPLLAMDDDFRAVMKVIIEATVWYGDGETAICFMGYGTKAGSSQVHAEIQDMLTEASYRSYYVGTVEAAPGLGDVLTVAKKGSYKKVVLEPLMIVTGDHVNNDMIGDEEGFWKTVPEDAGYEVTCLVNGLGRLEAIKQFFVEHVQAMVDSLIK